MDINKDILNKNADAHWKYTKGILELNNKGWQDSLKQMDKKYIVMPMDYSLLEYVYIQAFKHGYKHGIAGDYNI